MIFAAPKRLLFLFIFFFSCAIAWSQQYEQNWKKVEALVEKGKPASAFLEVQKIYELTKAENQGLQLIKALVYMSGLQRENRENNELLSIYEMEKEIINAAQPAKAILQNMLAEAYWKYFNSIKWKLYSRSKTENYKSYDIDTWGIDNFHEKITALFNASLENEQLLQSTSLEKIEPILIAGNARILGPTLYDLLANRAFDYLRNDERDITKPGYSFDLDKASAFSPAVEFVSLFKTTDSLQLQHPASLVLRKLLSFHLQDENPAALIDADIKRIEFVWSRSTTAEKDKLYLEALNKLAAKYGDHPAVMQASYLLASYYENKGRSWRPFGDTAYRYEKVKAKEICERVVKQSRDSEGKTNCENLLQKINEQDIEFVVEDVSVPDKPFRVLVQYKNTPDIWLRVVKFDERIEKIKTEENYKKAIINLPVIREWQQLLPSTSDLQQHSAEIKIEALPSGKYMLLASSAKNPADKNAVVTTQLFYVSGISYIKTQNDVFVLDRESGQPLRNAAVQIWERGYTRDYLNNLKGYLLYTDSNGYFSQKLKTDEITDEKKKFVPFILYEINYKNDYLFINEDPERNYYGRFRTPRYFPGQSPNEVVKISLFTDRSIYRPGQEVYFKGIALVKDSTGRSGTTAKDYPVTIYLEDANSRDIDSLKLTTNEFGSISGKFQLPASGLNGSFKIHINTAYSEKYSYTEFSVEEYKRPRFFVAFETINKSYKLFDSIAVTGNAKAYAGNNIDGAAVKYRIVRRTNYIYDWYFWNRYHPSSTDATIAHGQTKTDDNGNFIIRFKASPDSTVDKNTDPVFDYIVYADVTDINGETRSDSKQLSAGYKSLIIRSALPARLAIDSLQDLQIQTQNMNGGFEPARINVYVIKLKDENRLIRNRNWQNPDQYVMSKQEFIFNFPHDEYEQEANPRNRAVDKIVHRQTDSSNANGKWLLKQFEKITPGFYMIELLANDKDGNAVKEIKFIELYNHTIKRMSNPAYLYTEEVAPIEPGEIRNAVIGTSAEKAFLIQQTNKGNAYLKPISKTYSFYQLNNEKRTLTLTATEADRGGYGLEWFFVKHNQVHRGGYVVAVPWTNKDLKIEYASFRNKTTPGSLENWKLKISGYKNENLAVEVLASMYDASLDQLSQHGWYKPFPWVSFYRNTSLESGSNFTTSTSSELNKPVIANFLFIKQYDELFSTYTPVYKKRKRVVNSTEPMWWANPLDYSYGEFRNPRLMRLPKPVLPDSDGDGVSDQFDIEHTTPGCPVDAKGVSLDTDGDGIPDCMDKNDEPGKAPETKVRTNFNETAFFLPNLHTDSSGAVKFSFTIPESLTQWRFQALAHTKELSFGYSRNTTITQKQLMVQPNAPRFLREKDSIAFTTKIVNLSGKLMKGEAILQLVDAETEQPYDVLFKNKTANQTVSIPTGKSIAIKFPFQIPSSFNKLLKWRIVCKTITDNGESFSDGEENIIPVLPHRMLVTEALSIAMRQAGTKNFSFDKLINSSSSKTLAQQSLTVEFTTNPVWYAIQSLPYLMEYPYECAEQTWNRYYANALATYIINASPNIRKVFDNWKADSTSLLSNLQKNENLKTLLLEESPWLSEGNDAAATKKKLGMLFDLFQMKNELDKTLEKLVQKQTNNGGFAWFSGGPEDRYITQYILTGIGHLKKLGAWPQAQTKTLEKIVSAAMPWLDKQMKEDYDDIKKDKEEKRDYVPDYADIQYLYMRSFFPQLPISGTTETASNYYLNRIKNTWQNQSNYIKGMIALILSRNGNKSTAGNILISLKETSITNEELGMYWKDQTRGWFWYEAPIETHSLLIETFQEVANDTKTVDDLRTWLLKNKQTNNWKTTKATAEACYALLLQGTEWLSSEPMVEIKLGNTVIKSTDAGQEAGTGYFKKTIEGTKVTPQMGNISVNVSPLINQSTNQPINQVSWGGVYWQYFEDLDKITTAVTPLKLSKKLFVEKNTDRGPVITPVNDGDIIKVGDKIKVRVELRVDRDMEYVHMKDMRASALEPTNVLSSYKWQGGLGYYESTKDASTNFFFNYLRKGTYVFEYTLFATHTGNFSNGVTTIQCMYAPEFTSHSEGVRINVE